MKKSIAIILSVFLCISLFGCSANVENVYSEQADASSTQAVTNDDSEAVVTTSQDTSTEENSSSSDDVSTSSGQISTSGASSSSTATTKATTTTQGTTKSATTKQATTTKKATTTTTTTKTTTEKSTITCTITIECSSIVDELSSSQKANISSDGVILKSYTVSVKNGTSLSNALKQACNENGISIESKVSNLGGITVTSIGGIASKDFGNSSGWHYSKNNEKYLVNCKNAVANGDSYVFSYTKSLNG